MEALIGEITSIVFAILGAFLIAIIKKNVDNKNISEALIEAVKYAEEKGEYLASKKLIDKTKGNAKMQLAKEYLDKIHPETYKKFGAKIEDMLEVKVAEVTGTGKTKQAIK